METALGRASRHISIEISPASSVSDKEARSYLFTSVMDGLCGENSEIVVGTLRPGCAVTSKVASLYYLRYGSLPLPKVQVLYS